MKKLRQLFAPGIVALLIPIVAFGAEFLKLSNPAPGAGDSLQDFIYLLIDILQLVGTPILVCCIIYAGFLLVTAGGNEEQISKSKMWILWTIVGATIILGAEVIADMVYGTAQPFY